jgi:malate synthase
MVSVAREIFNWMMPQNNQITKQFDYVITEAELLEPHQGSKTMTGLRSNIRVAVQYLEAWLRGIGAVAIYNLMEDCATVAIIYSACWKDLRYNVEIDGVPLTEELLFKIIDEEMLVVEKEVGDRFTTGKFQEAKDLFISLVVAKKFVEFCTDSAYNFLN